MRVTKAYTNKTGEILYSLHAFGEDLKLVLKKSDQLVTPEATIIKRHNGRTISQEKIAGLGYHTGFIHSKPGSSLAVKVKDDYLVCTCYARQLFFWERKSLTRWKGLFHC